MATPLTRAKWLDECAKLAKTYEEAMTDEAKALVEWLRSLDMSGTDRAADLIETQAREIERLQGLVSSYRLQIDQLHDRAALAGDSHD